MCLRPRCCLVSPPSPHLQTTTGKDATGTTTQEFNVFLRELLVLLESKKIELGMRRNDKFHLVLDNATVHAEAAAVAGNKADLWPQPPHSPDCNKPIEHVHGRLDAHMHHWLRQQRVNNPGGRITVEHCKAELQLGFSSIPASCIKADVESLPATWEAIIANHGGYVAAELS